MSSIRDRRGWVDRWVLGISFGPIQRAKDLGKVYVCAVLVAVVLPVLGLIVIQGPRGGLVDRAMLVLTEGEPTDITEYKRNVRFALKGASSRFIYSSKAGNGSDIFRALCAGRRARIWHEPASPDAQPGDEQLSVYQVEVDGRVIRSYEQVEQSWIADNNIFWWLLLGACVVEIYFVAHIWRARRLG